ncbi:hypothetical protein VCRA2121O157_250077 [Vibrio crassostreae]|nr:hypothetical protein VCRA2113O137_210106 [Vibrio crassostreae]CAK1933531.1 hypothetical protein VCRA2113O138_250015 [Vibrio crassostreae]CAK1945764.1 hypothetical protein VCRA2113O140_250077 [Vibrio crassostreae]CAK2280690.1 hypothetical protein VCRA2116O141_180016 [Vibrio crassostreae]CAK2526241.1 hypothetical protein VCRA2113O415_630001 [Vibrio crassostreae]
MTTLGIFGAVVRITNSSDSLKELLGRGIESIKDEEWILVSGDDEDLHCTVQLTGLRLRN